MNVKTWTEAEIDEANKNYPDFDNIQGEIREFAGTGFMIDKTFVGLYLVARSISALADRVDELTKVVTSIRNGPLNP